MIAYKTTKGEIFMGKIDVLAKWNSDTATWNKEPNFKLFGRSFAIANYEDIINNNGKIDYIIITHGSRVEDHSKDFFNIKEKEAGIKNIINHYKQCNKNYSIKLFLMDADAPIIEDAKLFAKYIEHLAALPATNSINVIGLSKCSVMNFYVPRFFKNRHTFKKVNLYNTATPYEGTKLASPLIFYPEVKKVISLKIHNEKIANLIYKKMINIYENISSNSHMDYDIAIPGGIPESKKDVYDPSLIANVFCSDNIEAIKKLTSFRNILTGIDSNTLKESISTMNFSGVGLCILDDVFFDHKSDGMVYVDSQRKVESVLDIKSDKLISAHHDVNSNKRVINDLLWIVDDTIAEFDEKHIKKLAKQYF